MNLGNGKMMMLPVKLWQVGEVYKAAMDGLGVRGEDRLSTLSRGVYKPYYFLFLSGYQPFNSKVGYLRSDDGVKYGYASIAKACGCSKTSMQMAMGRLYGSGLAVKRSGRTTVKGALFYFPELEGCDYALVDARKAMSCFAYGAPVDAWGVYLTAHNWELSFPVDDGYRELSEKVLVGKGREGVGFALEWLKSKGLVQERRVWSGGRERVLIEALA